MQLEDIGLYMHFELDANDAALLNAGGDAQIELAQTSCDNSEICLQCREATTWVEGVNKVLIPFGQKAAFSDGTTGPFDLHETINHFRIYSVVPSMETTIKVFEVAIVDIGGVDTRKVGSLFGDSDTYLQMDGTLTTPPSSFEASIKMDEDIVKYAGIWEIGLPAAGRYSFITTTTGATTADDAEDYGIPADTAYQKYLIPQATASNGYFGTNDKKFTAINIPDKYTKADLALTFWMYWKPSVSGTPFNLMSYIELTSSGKCDTNELCWGPDNAAFSNLKEG